MAVHRSERISRYGLGVLVHQIQQVHCRVDVFAVAGGIDQITRYGVADGMIEHGQIRIGQCLDQRVVVLVSVHAFFQAQSVESVHVVRD